MSAGYVLRAPWYVRERQDIDLQDPSARRIAIQKYDTSRFADRILADPRDSLQFGHEDRWSLPVPIPLGTGTGRERLATHRLCTTDMRKLYQPTHNRFYTVVVEVFCDEPGLPRAGRRDDFEVGFVMRRQRQSLDGDPRQIRRLSRKLVMKLACDQHHVRPKGIPADHQELLWADLAWRRAFVEDNAPLIQGVEHCTVRQSWMVNKSGGVWRDHGGDPHPEESADPRREEEFSMWRLPAVEGSCEKAETRSLWFGVVPTYSAEHWVDDTATSLPERTKPKLDEHEIYEIVPFVREVRPAPCTPRMCWGAPSEPFRLAAPFDPDGTKNHSVTVTAPDLRRLAAHAGQPQGPGGVRIVTPPGSTLKPVKIGELNTSSGENPAKSAGNICVFAFELFFLVALFLFQLFLPIIVFLFQLWWMLALRFCFPPSDSLRVLSEFFAKGNTIDKLVPGDFERERAAVDQLTGMTGGVDLLRTSDAFEAEPQLFKDLVAAMDPEEAVQASSSPLSEQKPKDPLCQTD